MEFGSPIMFLEEVSPGQIEVEVETTETCLFDPLLDHNYNLTTPQPPSKIPTNIKIRELKALYHCSICGYATFKKDAMQAHSLTHKKTETPVQRRCVPCPSCTVKEKYEKCPKCSYYTKRKASLKIHMSIHMKENPYKCTECDHRVKTLKELIQHFKTRCHLCNCSPKRKGLAQHSMQCIMKLKT
ncbi:zinc finger protein 809-like [Leguminivora glycinivorella]|uniref:zinc finger protein 809-like n=1 Tax=Leguminivora glycinivorella TaxID=1035111 RepID=UPI00200BD9DE|nr:zinc finger protein 809-like [Leguminivora glycinivorella]